MKDTASILAILREMEASGKLTQGKKLTALKAVREIGQGIQRKDQKMIQSAIAALIRVFQ